MANELPDALQNVLENAWTWLQRGINDPDSSLRTPVLATVDRHCLPDARTVVIESIDAKRRTLYFNTDCRSPKFDEITSRPDAVLVFHEGDKQIRIWARLGIHRGDNAAHQSWEMLPTDMKALYTTRQAPGAPASAPTAGLPPGVDPAAPSPAAVEPGFENYALLEAEAIRLDWLHLSPHGHRRAAFQWEGERVIGSWVFP